MRHENRHYDNAYMMVAAFLGFLLVSAVNPHGGPVAGIGGAVMIGYIGYVIGSLKDDREAQEAYDRNREEDT